MASSEAGRPESPQANGSNVDCAPAPRTDRRTVRSRRTVLVALLGSGSAMMAGFLAIPSLLAVLTPAWRSKRRDPWRLVGKLEDFSVGGIHKAIVPIHRNDWAKSLNEKSVYVWRRTDREVVVYSRNCTDLSCPVHFEAGSACFFCPCHGGIFDKEGTPIAGPPRQPLHRYATRLRGDAIEIDLDSVPLYA